MTLPYTWCTSDRLHNKLQRAIYLSSFVSSNKILTWNQESPRVYAYLILLKICFQFFSWNINICCWWSKWYFPVIQKSAIKAELFSFSTPCFSRLLCPITWLYHTTTLQCFYLRKLPGFTSFFRIEETIYFIRWLLSPFPPVQSSSMNWNKSFIR